MSCSQPATTESLPFTAEEVRPLFRVQWAGTVGWAGHAFLLDQPGSTSLALTAHHVAGPLSPLLPTDPVATTVSGFLGSPVDATIGIRLGARLPVPGARTIGAGDSQHDLAVFRVLDWDATRALQLAAQPPAVGDTVWVLAVHIGSGGPDQHPLSGPRRHRARVDVSHDSAFVYTYLGSANANFTSGAAVLDRDGRVVGVNVGTMILSPAAWQGYREKYGPCCTAAQGGEVVGVAVGLRAITTHLARLSLP